MIKDSASSPLSWTRSRSLLNFYGEFDSHKGYMIHHTKNKGDLGQAKVYCNLIELGLMVLAPQTEHAPFDLVAYDGKFFERIQVKYRKLVNGKVDVVFRQTWADKSGSHVNVWDKEQIDIVAIYCPDTNKCYYFRPEEFEGSATLRVETPKNVVPSINWAKDYESFPSR